MTFMPRRLNERSSSLEMSGVLERRQSRQVLEQRHLDAGVVVEAGELDADRAAADDDDALGQRVAGRGLVAGDDLLAVRLEAGQRLDP